MQGRRNSLKQFDSPIASRRCRINSSQLSSSIKQISIRKIFPRKQIQQLSEKRVVINTLVYIINIAKEIADEKVHSNQILTNRQYFGQYGTILKCKIKGNRINGAQISYSAHISYSSEQEASACIQACNNFTIHGKQLSVTYGTTKYCSYFLKEGKCPKRETCPFLHSYGEQQDIHTKSYVTQLRHIQPQNCSLGRSKIEVIPPDNITSFLPSLRVVIARENSFSIDEISTCESEQYPSPTRRFSFDSNSSRFEFAQSESDDDEVQENCNLMLPANEVIVLQGREVKELLAGNFWIEELVKLLVKDKLVTAVELASGMISDEELVTVLPKVCCFS